MDLLFSVDVAVVLVISLLLSIPFILYCLHLFVRKNNITNTVSQESDIACVITAYKNVEMAFLAADSLLKQDYKNYHVYIVADNCSFTDIEIPTHPKLTVLIPQEALGSKVRSMKFAVESFARNHDAVAIFDPDNLADVKFLKECNRYLSHGYKAVQGRRTAKNLDSTIACLDAMGELYYNYTTKEIPFNLGSSSIIAGSGMIIERSLFEDFFETNYIKDNFNKVIPGEDKALHYYIVAQGEQIAYNANAILYDEKINNAGMVKNQRARWVNAYLINLRNAGSLFLKGLASLDANRFIAGILTLYPPLFLLVLSALLMFLINLFYYTTLSAVLFVAILIFTLNFMLVLKTSNAHRKIWKAFWGIPYFMVNQVLALLNIRKSNKDFLTTENTKKVSLEDVMKNSQ